jgi:hypothetical protein
MVTTRAVALNVTIYQIRIIALKILLGRESKPSSRDRQTYFPSADTDFFSSPGLFFCDPGAT